jgi:hypothetical protein
MKTEWYSDTAEKAKPLDHYLVISVDGIGHEIPEVSLFTNSLRSLPINSKKKPRISRLF